MVVLTDKFTHAETPKHDLSMKFQWRISDYFFIFFQSNRMSVPILIINWFISKAKLNKKKIPVMLSFSFMYRTVSRGSVRKQIKYT